MRFQLVSRKAWLAGLGGLLLATIGCAANKPPPLGFVPPAAAYRVAAGDTLQILVLPEPPVERTVVVRPDGNVSLDLIGDVPAEGRTPEAIAREIEKRISDYRRDPVANVTVAGTGSATATVIGEVNTPGRVPLASSTSIPDALAMAGGSTELGARSRIRLIRNVGGATQVHKVNLDRIRKGDSVSDLRVEPGDLIVVPGSAPVVVGYWIRRALFPLEQVLRVVLGPIAIAFAFTR